MARPTTSTRPSGLRPHKPGTSLVRIWRGQRLVVHVLESGFAFEDRVYPSLTAIAEEVTGSHRSGPAFFGLTKRGASS